MPASVCPQCQAAIDETSAFCQRCGALWRETTTRDPAGTPLGACYGCQAPAFGRCADCDKLFCLHHGGIDWAKFLACNLCRRHRQFLLLVILPVTLALFCCIYLVVRYLFR